MARERIINIDRKATAFQIAQMFPQNSKRTTRMAGNCFLCRQAKTTSIQWILITWWQTLWNQPCHASFFLLFYWGSKKKCN